MMNSRTLMANLEKIEPEQLRGYLTANDWVEDGAIRGVATIWHRQSNADRDFEAIQPNTKDVRDFSNRVHDLLLVLAEYERRPVEQIFREISDYFADLIRIRVSHDDLEGGSIPIQDGVLLIEKAKELVTSATLSTLSKKKYFAGHRPQDANDFIEKVRLGQTEEGSYIVNIIAPMQAVDNPQHDFVGRIPFARAVTNTLANSLKTISSTLEEFKATNSLELFDDAVEQGVSANMCDALIGLSGEKKSREFSVGLFFSKSIGIGIDSVETVEHKFYSEQVPYLEKASEYLKDNFVVLDVTFVGIVKKLDRDADKEVGMVAVTGVVEGKERNVSFELKGDDYLNAIHAHESKQVVQCHGDVYISPRSAKLLNHSGFRIIGSRDMFD